MYKDKIIELCIFHIDEKDNRIENLQAVNGELRAEINDLKGENIDLINHADFIEQGKIKKIIDGFKAEIRQLKADNKRLQGRNGRLVLEQTLLNDKDGLYDEVKELQAENKRLVEQVSSNSGNSSSTHTHTLGSVKCSIAREIAEYMDHNEGCGGARLFLIPRDEFNDGEYDNTIYWDDGIE